MFAVGLRELKTKSAEHTLEPIKHIMNNIDDRIEATRPKDGETPKRNHVIFKEIRATMSDRASTQKLLNQHIEELLNEVIPKLEEAIPYLEEADKMIAINL